MKKCYTLLATALLCAAATQAQDAPVLLTSVEFNVVGQKDYIEDEVPVENCYLLPSVDDVVEMKLLNYKADLAEAEGWTPFVTWTMGTGYAIDLAYEKPVEVTEDTYTFTLNKEKWGNPAIGNYYVTVMLCFVKLDEEGEIMDMLYGEDEEPVMFDVSYTTPNVFPAELQYVSPDNKWEDETFAEAYKHGEITFAFNNEVTFDNVNNIGTVNFYTVEDDVIETEITSYSSDWNRIDGFWTVTFSIRNEDFDAEDLAKIEVKLSGVKSVVDNSSVPVPTITLDNASEPQNAPRKKQNRMADSLLTGNELVNVYNVQGILIQENVTKSALNNLPAGLYIVDGKKIVVR